MTCFCIKKMLTKQTQHTISQLDLHVPITEWQEADGETNKANQ